ncbi:hypothetical protein [Sphingomonas sp.]|uniref:hypothetical protein n=1 Tax=Sphingomonas sp. TaxID=28214 RepID=UPI001B09287E|nr:hypothetical protein [Sphingomonas sp.]MBO9712485.1 hypothetical protein [Sphingomonas sp.]
MSEAHAPQVEDRVTHRHWELDLSLAGKVKPPKKRRYKARRQQIVRFLGQDGSIERFAIRMTIPYPGYEAFNPPSQAQYSAVMDYFQECCETPFQASTMLSARDYAEAVADRFSFTAPRRRLIALSTAAFILSDREVRALVRSLNIATRSGKYSGPARRSAHVGCYKRVTGFASKLIDDMRGEGSEIFG